MNSLANVVPISFRPPTLRANREGQLAYWRTSCDLQDLCLAGFHESRSKAYPIPKKGKQTEQCVQKLFQKLSTQDQVAHIGLLVLK